MLSLLRHTIVTAFALVVCLQPAQAEVVINEIMFNSAGTDTEYVEIFNPGDFQIDLSNWSIKDDNDTHVFILPVGTTLSPGEYLVFCEDTTAVRTKYGAGPDLIGNLTFSLSNGGDQVRIFDGAGALRDSLEYDDNPPWPPEADGSGPSLELLNPTYDNRQPVNWTASVNGYPHGTPGSQNSVYTEDQVPIVQAVQRDISLPTNADEVTVTARVFDDHALDSVELVVNVGGGYIPQTMYDDAAHNDGAAGDSIYGSIIPPQSGGTLVRYYVAATDNADQLTLVPPGAPVDYYAYTVDYQPPDLVVNEVLAVNQNGIMDNHGEREDWIEIKNRGQAPVNLGGMYLSDNPDQPREWELPEYLLDPGGLVLIWADDEPEQGQFHAQFKLSGDGDEVVIFDQVDHGNVVVDMMTFGLQSADVSFGYHPESSATAPEHLTDPSPGAYNDASSLFSPICINEFLATSVSGGIDDWVEIHNRSDAAVDIGGWGLTDDRDLPNRFTFPPSVIVPAGSYLVLTELDLGFAFSSEGDEIIQLSRPDSTTGMDYYDFGPQSPDVSEGRYPNGVAIWEFYTVPTPGLPNVDPLIDVKEPQYPAVRRRDLRISGLNPNPFRHSTCIQLDLSSEEHIELSVYDATGRLVRILHEGPLQGGVHTIYWNGLNRTGDPVCSGVYFVRLQGAGISRTRTVICVE